MRAWAVRPKFNYGEDSYDEGIIEPVAEMETLEH